MPWLVPLPWEALKDQVMEVPWLTKADKNKIAAHLQNGTDQLQIVRHDGEVMKLVPVGNGMWKVFLPS